MGVISAVKNALRFINLLDAPASYVGAGQRVVRVKADESGLEFVNIGASNANVVLFNVDCEASVYIGAAVIMQVSGVAKNALADDIGNSNVIGIVESKPSGVKCDIRVSGITAGIFSGLDVTKEYYLSDSIGGEITTLSPITTGHVRLKLGQPFSASEFLVMKGERTIRG
jgi:hypothetical protein